MPKPVKKAAPKKPAAKKATKRPSSDPVRRAGQLMTEHLDKVSQGKWAHPTEPQPPWNEAKAPSTDDIRAILSAHMKKIGSKGGKVSGAKRMEMPEKQRRDIAMKAAQARWKKKPTQS